MTKMKLKDQKLSNTVTEFSAAMELRLAEKEAEGKKGWETDSFIDLITWLMESVDNLDIEAGEDGTDERLAVACLDLSNYALMIWAQCQPEADAPT
jgi:hypothetical protein